MAENPFFNEEAAAAAEVEAGAESPETAPEEVSEVAENEAESGDSALFDPESTESELFGDAQEPEKPLALVDEPEEEMPEKPAKGHWVPGSKYKAAKKESQQLEARVTELEGELEGVNGIAAVVSEVYAGFADPSAVVKEDATFMSALEKMAQADKRYAQMASDVKQYIETGEIPAAAQAEPAPVPRREQVEATENNDPRIQKMAERTARRLVTDVLSEVNVPKDRHGSIWRYILAESGTDIADLEEADVIKLTREWAEADGVDLKALVGKPAEEKPATPPTGMKRSATTPKQTSKDDSSEDDKPKAAQSLDEWKSNRARFMQSMVSELAQE